MNDGNARSPISTRPPVTAYGRSLAAPTQPTTLADLLERVLDKGIVIAGDVTLSLGSVEILTLKIRLLIASVDKAQEIGINWWQSDPALSSRANELERERDRLEKERDQLKDLVERLETKLGAQPDGAHERLTQPEEDRDHGG